jgi:protein-S-isoprenylcysteine O-methyltransferase Ste14
MTQAPTIDAADRPGVIARPPLVYLAAVLVGVALHLLVPLVLPLPGAVRGLGAGLFVVGIGLAGTGRARFIRAGTNVNPMKPATTIVSSGIYRFSRNPMYAGMAVAFVGLALLTRIGWLLIELPVVLGVMHWGVILREERYLAHKFGSDYADYRARVRRYF